jgi:hypothetical protein
MLGKATLKDYPGARVRKVPPFYIKLIWTLSHLRSNPLKDTIMLLFWLTIKQDINGFRDENQRQND